MGSGVGPGWGMYLVIEIALPITLNVFAERGPAIFHAGVTLLSEIVGNGSLASSE